MPGFISGKLLARKIGPENGLPESAGGSRLSRECGLLLTNALRRVGDGETALRTSANVLSQAMAADDVDAQVGAHILMADLERQGWAMSRRARRT